MTLEPFDLSSQTIEPPTEGGLHAFGIVRRQKGRERALNNQRLWYAFAIGVVGQLDRKLRWQAKGVLASHGQRKSEIDAVARIHCSLPRGTKSLPAQHTSALNIVIGIFQIESKFR